MHIRTLLLTSLSVLALASGAVAQDHGDEPQEVIITGNGYRVTKDAMTSHVDVVTRTELDQKPAQGLGDALAYMPGVRSSSFAPGASRPVIRGLDTYRVLVLNNGLGAVDVSALSPDHAVGSDPLEAKRIEILRGPSALAYGGNAIGGVINVIDDRIPTSPASDGVDGRVTAQLSSVDDGKQLGASAKAGKGPLVFAFDLSHRKTEDYDTPVGPESRYLTDSEGEAPDTGEVQTNSASELTTWGAGASWIGDFGFAGLAIKQTEMAYGVPGHSHEGEDAEGPVTIGLDQTRYDVRSEFNLSLAGFNRLTADAGHTDYEHTEFEGGEAGTRFVSGGSEYRVALIRDEANGLSGVIGVAGLERDFEAFGDEAFLPSTQSRQTGIFTKYRYDKDVWGLEGGVRFDRTALSAAGFDRDFNTMSGSVGGFYRPSDHAFAGISLTRSERAPSDVELLAEGPHAGTGQFVVGDAGFDTEVGQSLELTGHITVDRHNRFAIDGHLYASRFDNFIDLRPTGDEADGLPVFQYVQTDADLWGFELEASAGLFGWKGQAVRLEASYDFVRGDTDLGPIARIPPSAVSARLTSEGGGWASHLEVRSVADRTTRLAELELPTQGYVMVNLFSSYRFASGVTVFGEVRNLGDAEIREATSATKDLVVAPGRNVRMGLAWSF
ncbi:TonB-dependent receptor domain-containing protein [Asticcacaulis biprosthecium]|nr:TonB-dependent receptor [Asticcacaulis biprosthecium]